MATSTVLLILFCCLVLSNGRLLERVLVEEAREEGALCLDGSLPGYFIGKGSGSGADKWVVHQIGGDWCYTEKDCLNRSKTELGSSKYWPTVVPLGGLFSDNKTVNGEFYNWNVVALIYCDGGSFSGFREDLVVIEDTTLYFRGKPIFLTLIQHLLDNGMENATDIILTGCSAGGVATFLHADLMATLIPEGINYKAMADGGYIPNVATVTGEKGFELYIKSVYTLHNTSGGSDDDCVNNYGPEEQWRCLFAPYTIEFVQSPIFIINSIYDDLILELLVGLECLPPDDCSKEQTEAFENYRTVFLDWLAPAVNSSAGIFADSCLIHCQTLDDQPWATFAVNGSTMRESFEEWYFEKEPTSSDQRIDCPFPCNPTCPLGQPTSSPTTQSAGGRAMGGVSEITAALTLLLLSQTLI